MNGAIFCGASPALDVTTKQEAKYFSSENAVVVPLPSASSLYSCEGVNHVIHVLGSNMNPNRPNCLDGDYVKDCEILRMAYTSLFEGFLVRSQEKLPKESIGLPPTVIAFFFSIFPFSVPMLSLT